MLNLFLDIAQPAFNTLEIKDISSDQEYINEFGIGGRTLATGYALGIKHSSESDYRWIIDKSNDNDPTLPTNPLVINNNSIQEYQNSVTVTNYSTKVPVPNVFLPEFEDGIYRVKYIVGKQLASTTLLPGVYYVVDDNMSLDIIKGSILTVINSITIDSGDQSKVINSQYEANMIIMLSANMLKGFSNAVIKLSRTENENKYQQIRDLISEFRLAYDRTQALVLVDNYDQAVVSFEDAQTILSKINNIL